MEVTRSLAIRTDSAMKMNKFMVMLGMMTALFTQNAASVQAQELKKFTLEIGRAHV